jgi:hypothetical protein
MIAIPAHADTLKFEPVVDCGKPAPTSTWLSSVNCASEAFKNVSQPGALAVENARLSTERAALYYSLKSLALEKMLEHLRFRQALRSSPGAEPTLPSSLVACAHKFPELNRKFEAKFDPVTEPTLEQYFEKGNCALDPPSAGSAQKHCHSLSELAVDTYYGRHPKGERLNVDQRVLTAITQADPALGVVVEDDKIQVLQKLAKLDLLRRARGLEKNHPAYQKVSSELYRAANAKVEAIVLNDMKNLCADRPSALVLSQELASDLLVEHPDFERPYCELFKETESLIRLNSQIHKTTEYVKTTAEVGGAIVGGAALFVSGVGAWIPVTIALDLAAKGAENYSRKSIDRTKLAIANTSVSIRTDSAFLAKQIEVALEGADKELRNDIVATAIGFGSIPAFKMAWQFYKVGKISLLEMSLLRKVLISNKPTP